jgi:hypothetical protein
MKLTAINPHFNACDQKWDLMHEQDDGRLCQSCERVLIDFTRTTEQEVLNQQRSNDFNLCGRYTHRQVDRLHRHLTLEESQNNRPWLVSLAMGLGSLLPVGVAAQNNLPMNSTGEETPKRLMKGIAEEEVTIEMIPTNNPDKTTVILGNMRPSSLVEETVNMDTVKVPIAYTVPLPGAPSDIKYPLLDVIAATDTLITLKGTVKDHDTKEPVPFAQVWIEGTQTGTMTDFDGNFALTIPTNAAQVTIIAAYIGYENDSNTINLQSKNKSDLALQMLELKLESHIMGIVTIVSGNPYTFGQKLRRWSNPANWYRAIKNRLEYK